MTETLLNGHKLHCRVFSGHGCSCGDDEVVEPKKLVLKIFHKGECPICNLDDVSNFLRDTKTTALFHKMDVQWYNIDTADGIAEAALERIATADMPVMMLRGGIDEL